MKKLITLVFSLAFLTACATTPTSQESSTETEPTTPPTSSLQDDITTENVAYYGEKPQVKGYLAMPSGEGPHPGIILIHEWWGMNQDIRDKAEDFAQEGYVALAVDLYDGESAETPDQARELATAVRENVDDAFANLNAAVDYLEELDSVDNERLASVGWCFGGQWSYEMAKNDLGTDVSIMYYGRFHPEDDLSQMRANLIGHFGEDDSSIPVDTVEEFRMTLNQQDEEHEIYIYENAGHAFANSYGDAYNEEAAEKAWQRSLDFLREHLQ